MIANCHIVLAWKSGENFAVFLFAQGTSCFTQRADVLHTSFSLVFFYLSLFFDVEFDEDELEEELETTGSGEGGRLRRRQTHVVILQFWRGFWCNCHSSYVRGHVWCNFEWSTQGLEWTTCLPTLNRYSLTHSIDGKCFCPIFRACLIPAYISNYHYWERFPRDQTYNTCTGPAWCCTAAHTAIKPASRLDLV